VEKEALTGFSDSLLAEEILADKTAAGLHDQTGSRFEFWDVDMFHETSFEWKNVSHPGMFIWKPIYECYPMLR
jgi:hypothetical protein